MSKMPDLAATMHPAFVVGAVAAAAIGVAVVAVGEYAVVVMFVGSSS